MATPEGTVTAKLVLGLIGQTGHARLTAMSRCVDHIVAHERGQEQIADDLDQSAKALREQIALLQAIGLADDGAGPLRALVAIADRLDRHHEGLVKCRLLRDLTAAILDDTAASEVRALKERAAEDDTPRTKN